jgi:PAS domain S-box-containing protein
MTSSSRYPSAQEAEFCYPHCRVVCTEAILTADKRWRVNAFNEGAEELLGYSADQVLGKPLVRLLKGKSSELARLKRQLGAAVDPQTIETLMLGKGQREIPARLSASILKDAAGQHDGFVAICHDLRPIRHLQTEMELKDQFFASILRNSADAILTLDRQERITSWNKGAEAIFGYTEEEMMGKSLELLMPEHLKQQKELEKISVVTRKEGFLRSYHTQRVTKDGQTIDVLFTRTAIRDGTGELIGYSSVLKNVTEQKLLDRHLAQMEKLSAIGEIAAGLAHEIKNPLAGIKGAIEIIRDSLTPNHPHRQVLAEVLSEVARIDRSVMNLLSYSKPKQPDFLKVNLVRLIKNVLSFLQKMADAKSIQLHLIAPCEVPLITGDEHELKQLFVNLILNSLEAIEREGNVWVRVRCEFDSHVRVEIADDGVGIPPEQLSKIFLPFFTSKKHGTGLGLATCKRIVSNHGGSIRVDSAPGKGAQFAIELALNSSAPGSLSTS